MKNRITLLILLSISVMLLCGGAFYLPRAIPMKSLIDETMTAPEGSRRQRICKWTLFTFYGNKKKISSLEEQSGLNFIIAYQTPINLEIFEWLLDNGADINCISPIDSLPPLHAALLFDNVELVELIMKRGADPSVREKRKNMTACEFLELLRPGKEDSRYTALYNALHCQ